MGAGSQSCVTQSAKTSYGILFTLIIMAACIQMSLCQERGSPSSRQDSDEIDFYTFTSVDILDNIISLERYRGMVTLVVNVASECGYTDNHYTGLNTLQEIFDKTKKFTVLAFPCNQFGRQEPGTNQDIYNFAHGKMRATFPLFAKINVLYQDVPPAWTYLINSAGQAPDWNFWKYLVDHNGHVIKAWGPDTNPEMLYTYIRDAIDKIDSNKQQSGINNQKKKHKDEF